MKDKLITKNENIFRTINRVYKAFVRNESQILTRTEII